MAKLYTRKLDGTYVPYNPQSVTNIDVVQTTGDSVTAAMSQDAVTKEFATKQNTLTAGNGISIVGNVISSSVAEMVDSIVNAGYVFAGVATPSTDTGTPDAKVFYIANGKGTYTNFGGLEVTEDEVVILYYNTAWHKVATGIASQEKLSELEDVTDGLKAKVYGQEEKVVTIEHTANKTQSGFSFVELDTPIEPHTIITSVTKDGSVYSGSITYKTSSGVNRDFNTSQLPLDIESYDMVSIGISYAGVYVLTHNETIPAIVGLDTLVDNLSQSINTISQKTEQIEEYINGTVSREEEIDHSAVVSAAWTKTNLDVKIDKGKDIVGILKDGQPYSDTIYLAQSEGPNWSVSLADLPYNTGSRDAIAIQTSTSGNFVIVTKETVEGTLSIDDKIVKSNSLYGKKWAVFGDSFSEGSGVGTLDKGKYKGQNKCYPYIIGNRNDMEIQKLFLSGRMIATPTSGDTTNSVSTNIYQQVDVDVDFITLYLGINDSGNLFGSGSDGEDYNRPITIGDINSTDIHTFYGAWNVVLKWLIENRPFAHIGIIVSNGMDSNDDLRKAEIAIANKWGIPFIDLNGDERTPMMHRSTNPNHSQDAKNARLSAFRISASNTHPNAKAYEYESTFIENFLRTL